MTLKIEPLKIEPLTAKTFAPFGRVIAQPPRPHDAGGPGWRWWGENALLTGEGRPYAVGYLALQPAELKFDWVERHLQTDEMIVPGGADCLVYVAPAGRADEPGRLPPFDTFRVFQVPAGQAVLLGKGVWHGAPLALDAPLNAIVLLLTETGTRDLDLVRFPATPVKIERS